MGDWIAFWDSEHSIYVNARHRDVHYRLIAEHIRSYVAANASVLDYGCGEALHADIVAGACQKLMLCEAAPKVRAGLTQRFAGNRKIEICAPDGLARLPAGTVDVVVMHSVAQYLTPAELDQLLARFHALLKDGGTLIVGDIIPPDVSALTDASALLRLAAANGFLGAALLGLARTVASDYWRLRSHLGLTRYSEAAMLAKLAAAGFRAQRAAVNIGHNPARMTFQAVSAAQT
ncbi:MAG: class I SAM-dependent methyltransferase [Hyphomicrobiales bacterium]|nr:class I SAM-dependent methyltransferase [Hyphomicrobiales bacterium]